MKIRMKYFLSLVLIIAGLLMVRFEEKENTVTGDRETLGIIGEEAKVIRVVDGDTIEVEGGRAVRYLGIDTPETVDPRRPVGCFGKEASMENKRLVEGQTVILEKDISDIDKYGRILRYVYLRKDEEKLLFVNDYLVRNGYAQVVTYPPDVKHTERFLQAETEARENNRGLWNACL